MASLTGQLVAETYKALLKVIDNDVLTASEKQITDGFGGGSNVFIDSNGFLRANKYKITNGLATQFLKADGSLDANTYLTSITSAQVTTALGYTPVTDQRTLTINGVTYNLTANRSWTVEGTAAVWGNITGTLSNQTDLQAALNAKYNVPAGTISQYIRGDGTLATFPTLPGGLPTGGTAGQILSKIDATDYNAHWIDNYATQTKNEVKLGATLAKGTAVYVSSANGTNMIVSAASNTAESLSSKTFGLLETGGVTNDLVKCVTFGLLAGLDTSAAQAGDPVWLGVNGALLFGVANKPVAPANMVYIGVVTRVQSNNGEIFVNIQNGFEIEELHDVLIQSKANNQGLFYESSTGLWKNKSIATVLGYTPQAQLSGTGFVKASGTTISYDNSTYLTTTDAASTYQRLDKMVSNLLPSATEYPNSNAVIAALALKADAANPVFTGYMTISGAEPKLYFTDTDQNPDYFIGVDAGFFRVYDQTAGATRFVINSSGVTTIAGDLIVGTIAKSGGTASQFLKADGSVDATDYATVASLSNYLLSTTAASTYQRLDKMVSNLLPSSTEYPNSNAVINALALKADAANPVFTGNMTISGAEPKLYFVDTDQNPDYTVFIDSGFFYIYDQTAGATRFSINSSGNISTGVGKSITAGSFIKESGTASQYLMADGSVSTLSGLVTGSGTSGYLPKWTSASAVGNSIAYDNGSQIAISGNLELTKGANRSIIIGSAPNYDWRIRTLENDLEIRMADVLTALKFYYPNGSATFISSITATGGSAFNANSNVLTSEILTIQGGGSSGNYGFTINAANGDRLFYTNHLTYNVIMGTTGGNVLIGTTTNPGNKLYVAGSIKATQGYAFPAFSGGGEWQFGSDSTTGNGLYLYHSLVGYSFILSSSGFGTFASGIRASGLYLGSLTNEQLMISGTGSRGIGISTITSGDPYVRLYDNTTIKADIWWDRGSSAMGINSLGSGSKTAINPFGGNVGIGTLNPNSILEISTVTPVFRIQASNADNFHGIEFRQGAGFDAFIKQHPNSGEFRISNGRGSGWGGFMTFYTDTVERQRITPNGRFGFNTSSVNRHYVFSNPDNRGAGGFEINSFDNIITFLSYNRSTNAYLPISLSEGSSNVLIGTNTDSGYRLYVNGTGYFNSSLTVASDVSMSGNLTLNTGANRFIQIGSNTNYYWRLRATGDDLEIRMADNFAALKMYYPNGAATFINTVTATAFFESSDIRLKTLIESNPIIEGIEKLEAKLYEKNGKVELGYFAQDAELIMPYAVTKNADGFLNLSYREVHTAKIARLEKEVAELKAQLNLN